MSLVKFHSRLQVNNMAYRLLLFRVIEMVGAELSYIVFLHQTTTRRFNQLTKVVLSYIVFLHQTTTLDVRRLDRVDCLISSFYIKPQLSERTINFKFIVLYRLSTSNHNHVLVV